MILTLSVIILSISSSLVAYCELKRYERRIGNVLQKSMMIERASFLLNKYLILLTNGKYSNNYPMLNEYFERNCLMFEHIVDNDEYKKIRIRRCRYSDKQAFEIRKELINCPKEYRKLYVMTNQTLAHIYKVKKPLNYFIGQVPYYVVGSILKSIIAVLSVLIRLLEMKTNNSNENKKRKNESDTRSFKDEPIYNAT